MMGNPSTCFLKGALLVSTALLQAQALWLGSCNKPLGVSTGDLGDSSLSASSSHHHTVGPHKARLGIDSVGGAWCPRNAVDTRQSEWLEVSLGDVPRLVTAVATQGRHAQGSGMEYTPAYTLHYWRPGMDDFMPYTASRAATNQTLLVGNRDTFTEVKNLLSRPVLATRVRLLPYSAHPRVVCLRLELYGCDYTDGVSSYSVVGKDVKGAVGGLGESEMGVGEGVLYDGRPGGLEEEEVMGLMDPPTATVTEGLIPAPSSPLVVNFKFDVMRRFKAITLLLVTSQLEKGVSIKLKVDFGSNSSHVDEVPVLGSWSWEDLSSSKEGTLQTTHNLTLSLKDRPGKLLTLNLVVDDVELNLQEIYFDSAPCGCLLEDYSRRRETVPEERTAERPAAAPEPPADVWAVYTARQHHTYMGVAVGFSVGVGLLVLVWVGVWLRRRRCKASSPSVFRRPPPDTLDMKSLMGGVGMNINNNNPTYEEGNHLLYDDLQRSPIVTPQGTLCSYKSRGSEVPVYATPTLLLAARTAPTTPTSGLPPPAPMTSPSNTQCTRSFTMPTVMPLPPPPPPPQQHQREQQIRVPQVTGPWLTCVYRGAPSPIPQGSSLLYLPPHNVTRTRTLASGAFATLSTGVVWKDGSGEGAKGPCSAALVTVSAPEVALQAQQHAQVLCRLSHDNVAGLMGVVVGGVGVTLVLEYQADAHLPEYLHARTLAPIDHHQEQEPDDNTISVESLVTMVTGVASGMAFLEARGVTHTDLSARNVLVVNGCLKVTQVGSALPRYSADYWRPPDGRGPAPLRWISPEALCKSMWSPSSDVWSFGVTVWEVVTLARRRPHHHLSDDLLFHALLQMHTHSATQPSTTTYRHPQVSLSGPAWCPQGLQEVMSACFRPNPSHRPTFQQILHTLQEENHLY
ncbi:unnamed protein product, partial [Meganyctiphanes norvegica]